MIITDEALKRINDSRRAKRLLPLSKDKVKELTAFYPTAARCGPIDGSPFDLFHFLIGYNIGYSMTSSSDPAYKVSETTVEFSHVNDPESFSISSSDDTSSSSDTSDSGSSDSSSSSSSDNGGGE